MNKQEIISKTLNGIETQDLVEYLSKEFNNPIVLISKNFKIIAHSSKEHVTDPTWLQAVDRGFITLEFGFNLSNWTKFIQPNKSYLEFKEINNHTRRFYKLEYRGNLLGYLNFLEIHHFLNDFTEDEYEFIVKVVSKEFYISTSDIHNTRVYNIKDILFSLHNEEFRSEFHFLQRTDNLNINNYFKYQLVVVDIKDYISYNASTDSLNNELTKLFINCVIITELNYLYILLCNQEVIEDDETLKTFLSQNKLSLNVSTTFTKLYDYKIYEKEALDTLCLKKYLDEKQLITTYDNVKLFKILTTYKFERDYTSYLDNTIIKIIDYDKEHNSELLNTLFTYLKHEKSVKIVASKLFIHRNTVNYRIKQLREIFNIDFDDFYTLVRLYLSIQLCIINKKKLD